VNKEQVLNSQKYESKETVGARRHPHHYLRRMCDNLLRQ
jgi:hypothetical protein